MILSGQVSSPAGGGESIETIAVQLRIGEGTKYLLMYYTGKDMKNHVINSENKTVTVEVLKNSLIYVEFTSHYEYDTIIVSSVGYKGVKGINNKSAIFYSSTDVTISYYLD